MGTSTRWKGPAGSRWSNAGRRLARVPGGPPTPHQRLTSIADDHLRALHETLRADPSAFGLHDAACAAGERLAGVLGSLAAEGEESTDSLLARFIHEVGGDGGTLADAAVRRGLATAVRNLRNEHPELEQDMTTRAAPGGLASDMLCTLYRFFFAGLVAEFLRSVVAEHLKFAVPLLVLDAENTIADRVAEKVLEVVPNPCEHAAETTGPRPDQEPTLPSIAASLVPEAVAHALGLTTTKEGAQT
ncbi:hypothetical protein [Streptomyces carpaticus]|uniref:Uncharacterized protein n=1 Tax=Streptomyces carpaticus TaxID=285558 RepID=A0ABV4ZIH4_9ACTN